MGKHAVEPNKTASINSLFFSLGLDMSWRLAISVLVPIIGGVYLDKGLHTSPAFLIVGFVLAIAGTVVTIRRTLLLANQLPFASITKGMKKPPAGDDDDD